jgi:hypothetical protein
MWLYTGDKFLKPEWSRAWQLESDSTEEYRQRAAGSDCVTGGARLVLTAFPLKGDKSRPAGAGPEPGQSRSGRGQGQNAMLTMQGHARNGLPAIRVTGLAL